MNARPTLLLVLCFAAALAVSGCDSPFPSPPDTPAPRDCPSGTCPADTPHWYNTPPADLPLPDRYCNYGPSCVHASFATVLAAEGRRDWAAWWVENHYGPSNVSEVARECQTYGIPVTATLTGDPAFFEACHAGHPALVQFFDHHAVVFAGWQSGRVDGRPARLAVLVNPNRPEVNQLLPESTFLAYWQTHYGGKALAVLW